MRKIVISSILFGVLIFAFSGCLDTKASSKSYTSEDIGIRKTSLFDESGVALQNFEYISTPAGESKNIARSFENAPPLIPHDVEGQMEITRDLNMCTTCHLPELAKELNATAMPKSHFISMITHKDLGDTMDEARYNCNQCHVPQAANLKPLVVNKFQAEFRTEDGAKKANLADVMNEGIE
ncbi:MAG: nitrate reductase cytochrome c-type subunit [Campylobacteraceae bacterium]